MKNKGAFLWPQKIFSQSMSFLFRFSTRKQEKVVLCEKSNGGWQSTSGPRNSWRVEETRLMLAIRDELLLQA